MCVERSGRRFYCCHLHLAVENSTQLGYDILTEELTVIEDGTSATREERRGAQYYR